MPDLLVPPFATATAVLDVCDPVDLTAPLNRGLLNWHLVLPHALGGVTWRNLMAPRHATLIAMEPRGATLGWNATRRQGGLGELRFNGVEGAAASVAASSVYDFLNTTFTVSCWMRATVAAQANLVARRLIGPAEGNWFFRMDSGGTITARIMDSTGLNVIAGRTSVSATLANGQWHHCLVVFTTHTTTVASNAVALYVNGLLDQGTQSSTGPTAYSASTQPVTFGALASLATPLNGALDDIRIYNRGLSGAEVRQLYQASRTGYRRELRWLTPPQVLFVSTGTVRSLTAAVSGVSTTSDAVASVLTRLTAPANAHHGYTFPATTSLVLPGAAHGVGHAALLLGLYDTGTPRQLLAPGALTIDASTFDVTITFLQPQAGLLVLSGGTPPDGPTGNYTQALSVAAGGTVTIPGATHGLGHPHLLVAVYDASTPRVRLTPGRVTVDPSSFDVALTFAQAATGLIVLAGYTGTGGTANRTVSLPGSSPVSIPQATHGLDTDALLLEVYDTSTPRRRVTPGRVTVHATTHEVVLTFAQAQLGTVVLNGSIAFHVVELVAAPVGTSTTPAALLQSGRSVVAHPQGSSLTSATGANTQRQLTAALQGSSATPSILVRSARLVAAHPQGASTTAAAVLAMGRPLLAHPQGTSTTPPALAGLLRFVTAHPSAASTTPTAVVTTARLLAAHPQALSTTPTAQGLAQSPTRLVGVDFSLGAPGIVTIPAATHGLATAALLVQVWDAQTPRHKLTPGRMTVDPSTFTVAVHLAQAQSGRVVLAGAHPPTPQEGHYRLAFAPTTLLSLPASLHGFATADLLVTFTDAQAVPQTIEPGSVTLHPTTYELIATFAQPQGGTVVLVGSAAASASPHYTQAFGPATSVTFDGDLVGLTTTHLLLQIWDTQTPRQQVQPGRVTIDPSSHVVTVTFAQAQAGTLVATGLARLGLWLAHPVAASTTPSAVVQTVHRVVAHPQGSSTTPVALGALVRGVIAHPQGLSTTPTTTRQLARALQAHPQGASVTQAATVQTAALVSFLAHPQGSSTTPATLKTLLRQGSAAVQGASTTPMAVTTLLRHLSAQPQATSTTPLSVVRQGRALSAHPQGVSLTPAAAPQLASQMLLTAAVQGVSATPTVLQSTGRILTAQAQGTSTTPAALLRTQRSLLAAVGGSSSTSVSIIQLPGQIQLQVAAMGGSTTPAAVVRTARLLTAAPLGASLTPLVVSLLTRRVTAHPQGASTTPVAVRQLVRGLLAHAQGVSLSPAVVRLLVRRVTAHPQASSTTLAAIRLLTMRLVAHPQASSVTPVAVGTMGTLRQLVAHPQGMATTPAVLRTTQRLLTAHPQGLSSTPATIARVGVVLQAAALGGSTTPSTVALLTRRVQAHPQSSSTTPAATAIVSTLVPLAAHAQTVSATPSVTMQLTRGLTAQPTAASTTPLSVLHTERLLSGHPQGASTTPVAVGAILRPLVSVIAGESSTLDIMHALSRGLTSAIQGTTQSPAIRVVTVRPLDAHPQALSVAPAALLIPFSGEFQLVAAIQGTSTSADAEAILLSMPRLTQVRRLPRVTVVMPRPRVTTVPASAPAVTD